MNVSSTVTVGTEAVKVTNDSIFGRLGMKSAYFKPASGTVYLGGPDVTTSTGFPIASTDAPFLFNSPDHWYLIAGSEIVTTVLQVGSVYIAPEEEE